MSFVHKDEVGDRALAEPGKHNFETAERWCLKFEKKTWFSRREIRRNISRAIQKAEEEHVKEQYAKEEHAKEEHAKEEHAKEEPRSPPPGHERESRSLFEELMARQEKAIELSNRFDELMEAERNGKKKFLRKADEMNWVERETDYRYVI